ncbi:MAG TPA: 4-(cytidine 5'-diphospho)-2-C-methyl-D-erythritol kinase [Longimicrobiales bacterium]|nr:4-(cytidine 5'-diphospho)-2-C-methyl-D-erythritol kinase [Longimicrobiales bacterium]
MHIAAPAKLNLFLDVLAREASGYHQLETLFCALELADELEIERARAGIAIEVAGAELGPPEQNLAHRAAAAYFAARGDTGGVRVRLHKSIPAGAGLGGGSSDAAAVLRALDRIHDAPLGGTRLLAIAAELGSDVPFFLCGSPLALAWGRGGRLLPLEPLPAADVLLVVPGRGMATGEAFAALAREASTAPPAARVLRADRLCDWEDIAALARNDFEPIAFAAMPELARAKRLLLEHGAVTALLTGSGATVYGVFRDRERLGLAAETLARELPAVHLIRTRTAAPPRPLPFG